MMVYQFYNMQMTQFFFMEHDLDKAKNMKLLLNIFEQLFGLKINFHKSEMYCYGKAKEFENQYMKLFGGDTGEYPFRCLGIPMHHIKLHNKDWKKNLRKNYLARKRNIYLMGGD